MAETFGMKVLELNLCAENDERGSWDGSKSAGVDADRCTKRSQSCDHRLRGGPYAILRDEIRCPGVVMIKRPTRIRGTRQKLRSGPAPRDHASPEPSLHMSSSSFSDADIKLVKTFPEAIPPVETPNWRQDGGARWLQSWLNIDPHDSESRKGHCEPAPSSLSCDVADLPAVPLLKPFDGESQRIDMFVLMKLTVSHSIMGMILREALPTAKIAYEMETAAHDKRERQRARTYIFGRSLCTDGASGAPKDVTAFSREIDAHKTILLREEVLTKLQQSIHRLDEAYGCYGRVKEKVSRLMPDYFSRDFASRSLRLDAAPPSAGLGGGMADVDVSSIERAHIHLLQRADEARVAVRRQVQVLRALLDEIREASLLVIEAVEAWRETLQRSYLRDGVFLQVKDTFQWRGENYLVRMLTDLDFLNQSVAAAQFLGCNVKHLRPPFLVYPDSFPDAEARIQRLQPSLAELLARFESSKKKRDRRLLRRSRKVGHHESTEKKGGILEEDLEREGGPMVVDSEREDLRAGDAPSTPDIAPALSVCDGRNESVGLSDTLASSMRGVDSVGSLSDLGGIISGAGSGEWTSMAQANNELQEVDDAPRSFPHLLPSVDLLPCLESLSMPLRSRIEQCLMTLAHDREQELMIRTGLRQTRPASSPGFSGAQGAGGWSPASPGQKGEPRLRWSFVTQPHSNDGGPPRRRLQIDVEKIGRRSEEGPDSVLSVAASTSVKNAVQCAEVQHEREPQQDCAGASRQIAWFMKRFWHARQTKQRILARRLQDVCQKAFITEGNRDVSVDEDDHGDKEIPAPACSEAPNVGVAPTADLSDVKPHDHHATRERRVVPCRGTANTFNALHGRYIREYVAERAYHLERHAPEVRARSDDASENCQQNVSLPAVPVETQQFNGRRGPELVRMRAM